MRRKYIYIVVSCILLGTMLSGCQKNLPKSDEKLLQRTEKNTENEEREDSKEEKNYDMGGLGNYFRETYEPSSFGQDEVDSDTVQWICAAYAIYTGYNGKELGVVGGILQEKKDVSQKAVKEALSGGWRITGRESAIKQLDKLLTTGQRREYQEFTKGMDERGLFDLTEDEFYSRLMKKNVEPNKYIDAFQAYQFYGESALDGWDYCRALQILGDCYVADYISLEECLDQSLVIAEKLQSEYKNWDEVCQSYLYGYQYWKEDKPYSSVSDTSMRRDTYEELKVMEDGPFQVLYDTELTATWKAKK